MAGIKVSQLPVADEPVAEGDRIPFLDASDSDLSTRLKTREYEDLVGDLATAVTDSLTESIVDPAEQARDAAIEAAELAIQGANPRGEWDSGAEYVKGDLVHYDTWAWLCKMANTGSEPALDNPNWSPVYRDGVPGPKGDQGDQGPEGPKGDPGDPGINWRGTWNAETAYQPRDAVFSGGSSYYALNANTNSQPPNANWALLAQKGLDGEGSGNMHTDTYDPDGTGKVLAAVNADQAAQLSDGTNTVTPAQAKAAHDHSQVSGNPHGTTAAQVGAAPASHDHSAATTAAAGFMSAADKEKLDSIEAGATGDQSAAEVPYSNAVSGLASTNVQNAIDELKGLIGEGGGGDASEELMLSNDALISLRLWQLQAAVIGQREGIEGFHGEGFFVSDDQVESVTDGAVVRGVLEGEGYASNEAPNLDALVKLPNPAVLPTGTAYNCAFSPDGVYLAVAHNASPFLTIYKRTGDTFTKLPDPTSLPTGNGSSCAFSSDATYLAVGHTTSPFLTIYKRSGDTFTKLPDPTTLPPGAGSDVSFSPDDTYLAVTHSTSPCATIYKRTGDTFTKLPDLTAPTGGSGRGCAFSPDGAHLVIALYGAPHIIIHKRTGDTFTKLPDPTTPSGSSQNCVFSPDGAYLAMVGSYTPYVTMYERDGDTFTKLANPSSPPPDNAYGCAFSADGKYLAVAHAGSPFVTIYAHEEGTLTKIPNPTGLPAGSGYGCAFAPDGYLAVAHATSPFVTIYKPTIDIYEEAVVQLVEKTLPYTADAVLIIDSFEGDAGSSRHYDVSLNGGVTWETVSAAELGTIKQLAHFGDTLVVRLVIESDGEAVGRNFFFVVYAKEAE